MLLYGSKLDLRRQDLFRARDRANDAYKLYEQQENKRRQMAEVRNHQASIELQDGNPQAASDFVSQAEELSKVTLEDGREAHMPDVVAACHQLRGLIARSTGQLEDAIKHFQQANAEAGARGMASLALDSGLSFGEALLAAGKVQDGRDALTRVVQIAQALRNPARERQAAELLAQAEGALRNFDRALPLAMRVLELSRQLNFENALPIDFYHAGLFSLLNEKPTEALALFAQSEQRVAQLGEHPLVKELYYFKGVAHRQVNQMQEAKASLEKAVPLLTEAKDWRKLAQAHDNLADVATAGGDMASAKSHLTEAVQVAKNANLSDLRKDLKKKLDSLG